MKPIGTITFPGAASNRAASAFARIRAKPLKAPPLEQNVALLRRLTGYPANKCRDLLRPGEEVK